MQTLNKDMAVAALLEGRSEQARELAGRSDAYHQLARGFDLIKENVDERGVE
jgi:hypothetical protein